MHYLTPSLVVNMMLPTLAPQALSPLDAGVLMKKKRNEKGLTLEQLAERVGVPRLNYIHMLEGGKYSLADSKYFPAIVRELALSESEIRMIKPDAFITLVSSDLERMGAHPYKAKFRIPVLGDVAAGQFPVKIFDEITDHISIEEGELPPEVRVENLFALRVQGDSMVSQALERIPPGSTIIAEARKRPKDGDVVVAWVVCQGYEGGVLKVYHAHEEGQLLSSWNPKGPVFRFLECEEVHIQGIVRQIRINSSAWVKK